MNMANEWFVRQSGKIYGPFDGKMLRSMELEGRVQHDTEVSNSSSGPWQAFAKIAPTLGAGVELELPPVIGQPRSDAQQERELWQGTTSQLVNIGPFLSGLLIIPIPWAIWKYIETKSNRYELTSQRFRLTTGVFSKQSHELELYRVKDTTFTQSFFQRMFGLATIGMITSDATTPEIIIESIPYEEAKSLREKLRSAVEEVRERKRVREVDYT